MVLGSSLFVSFASWIDDLKTVKVLSDSYSNLILMVWTIITRWNILVFKTFKITPDIFVSQIYSTYETCLANIAGSVWAKCM